MIPDVTEQVALAEGRIIHEGTGKAIVGRIQITAEKGRILDQGRDKKGDHVPGKILQDGVFAISGQPEFLFPNLDSQSYELNLTISAESSQFREDVVELETKVIIPSGYNFDSPLKIVPEEIRFGMGLGLQGDLENGDFSQQLRQQFADNGILLHQNVTIWPKKGQDTWEIHDEGGSILYVIKKEDNSLNTYIPDISFPADPVDVRGRVVEAANPKMPIGNAIVEIQSTAGTQQATTKPDGRYRFKEIVVLTGATIHCSAAGFKPQTRTLLIDFSKLSNDEYFRLVSS